MAKTVSSKKWQQRVRLEARYRKNETKGGDVEAQLNERGEDSDEETDDGRGCIAGHKINILEDKVCQDVSVTKQVSHFLSARSTRPCEHPEAIIRQIYSHRQSQCWYNGCEEKPHLGLPRYVLPASKRFSIIPQEPQNSTQNALDAWALEIVMKQIRAEADRLCELAIVRSEGTAPHWKELFSFDVCLAQDIISQLAPSIFAMMLTLAVNKSMVKKLDKQVDKGAGGDQLRIKRNPWLISTIARLDTANTLLCFGQAIKIDGIDFLLLIDNINKLQRSWDCSLLIHNQMLNGTAATLIKLEDIPDGALDQRLLAQHSAKATRSRKDLVVADLEERLDTALMRKLVCGVILKSLLNHVPAGLGLRDEAQKSQWPRLANFGNPSRAGT
ncbi:hypothetical protein EV121DRAFT_273995 [Schizophyllum commune]